jgi:hypothetical protein
VCGNGACEAGEELRDCSADGSCANQLMACIADCPVARKSCPAVNDVQCNGKGSCLPASGTCSCYAGYTGAECQQCAVNYVAVGPVCMRGLRSSVMSTSCSNDIQDGLETGVDCGGVCSPCSATSDATSSGSSALKSRVLLFVLPVCAVAVLVAGTTEVADSQLAIRAWLSVSRAVSCLDAAVSDACVRCCLLARLLVCSGWLLGSQVCCMYGGGEGWLVSQHQKVHGSRTGTFLTNVKV